MVKDKLARKYEGNSSRKTFSEDNLWKEPYDVMAEYPVILSTTFSSRNSLNSDVVYDYLIMDEASQVDIATGALALSCARNVVIVGDTKQLPNVVTDDIKAKAKAIFDSFNVSEGYQYTNSFLQSILDVMPNVTQTLLREHYRCHPKIINFCNQKFYRGELIIMTTDKGEEDVLSVVKTVAGNHERNHYSQRQIDVIKNEIIPKYVSNPEETGIIAPYKNQVEALSKEITDIDAATVHKFQGKEKENIIISTVDDEISDFADDPYLINVAVSRAKKKLMLVVTGNEQSKERNITDLIDYIQYNNFEVTESKIYSIFDYLYKQYTEERRVYLQKHKKVSEYDSENLMYSLIEDIISANKYSSLDVVCHFPLNMLIKNPELLNEQECQYAMNPATHLDFLIYNRIGKKPVLAIEVDGYEYHKEDASFVRKFGFALLDKGAEQINLKSFKYYDRMLPAQDSLPEDSAVGNLIALPLQGKALQDGNSAFIDGNWNAYPNQWETLFNKPRLSQEFLEEKIKEWSNIIDDIAANAAESDREKPWNRMQHFNKNDVEGKLHIILSNGIYVDNTNLKAAMQNRIRRMAAISNPVFYKNQAIGTSNYDTARWIYLGKDHLSGYIQIPRGLQDELWENIKQADIDYEMEDERQQGRKINVDFKGELRPEQDKALKELIKYDNGILHAATAFGKTVVSSAIIAQKKINTLIILESSALIEQWKEALEKFLNINEGLPTYETKTGRVRKRKSLIGTLQGAHDSMTGIIDIAMAGSLCKKGKYHKMMNEYGLVLIDECHHSASETRAADTILL